MNFRNVYFLAICFFIHSSIIGQTSFNKKEIIYSHKNGMATTMISLTPEKAKGKAIVHVVSGNWVSDYRNIPEYIQASEPYLAAGYTVFLTMHSSAPIYDITVAVADVQRAVQYIRYHAEDLGIDPSNIGITGGSSGGHVSLAVSNADDMAVLDSDDPISRASSKTQAVAVFYPPTDFLNFGMEGLNPVDFKHLLIKQGVLGAFQFKAFNEENFIYEVIEDRDSVFSIAASISPAQLVTSDDPPTFIIHGDKDVVVPLQQSQLILQKLNEKSIPAELVIKPGGEHGWENMNEDRRAFVEWFDEHLGG